jgi:purine nucleosidase
MKLLFDTDIGSDIDDAICLAYLLAQADAGQCDLLGITTVTGDTVARAKLASALCQAVGRTGAREVPIFPGAREPLLVDQRQPLVPQEAALERWPHRADYPAEEAITFLRDTIRAHPGEVTLLAVGPMTNVALLFATYPETAQLLKGLVMMIGAFSPGVAESGRKRKAEWNALVDPHAAAIVYRAALAPGAAHRSIGLDVTLKVTMPAAEVRERFQTPRLSPVLDMAEVWFRERPVITFHDPLAGATLFDTAIVQFEPASVEVELVEPDALGRTMLIEAPAMRPHEIATTVTPDAFFEHYFSVIETPISR